MVYCCVPFCKSVSLRGNGVSFHEFPSDESVRDCWLKAISRDDFVINDNSRSSVVCSVHFLNEDYVPNLKIRRLKKGAVPSVFPNYPAYKVPKCVPKRRNIERHFSGEPEAKRLNQNENAIECLPAAISLNNDLLREEEVAEILLNLSKHITLNENRSKEKRKKRTAHSLRNTVHTSKLKNMRSLLWKKNKKIHQLQNEIKILKNKLDSYDQNLHYSVMKKLLGLAAQENVKACFLLQQITNFFKKKPLWNEITIRECILWDAASPKGYAFVREEGLLSLPSKVTLKRYLGTFTGETGITDLVQERLKEEAERLNAHEKFCSLIIDEMAIKEQQIFDKSTDAFFGQRTVPGDSSNSQQPLANKLLCFLLSGLSTSYTIPCGYFFTRALTGGQLKALVFEVLQAVEDCGYLVIRIVTDNHKTNAAMLCQLSSSGKTLSHKIQHPLHDERLLFLSFDQNHIIKNLRSLFFKNDMTDGEDIISGKFIKQLYQLQKRENIKAVRNLSFKHISPTNFDKMNVARAVLIFSPPVTAALEFLRKVSPYQSQAASFSDCGATITFLKQIYKWFTIHDVSSRQRHILSNNRNAMHFFSCDDERLEWLETEFLPYMTKIKISSEEGGMKFLSKETHEALEVTTLSTVECIKYLLQNGFHYVLTRS